MKRLILLLVLGLVVLGYAGDYFHKAHTARLTITTDGDTAQVMTLTPDSGMDSMVYLDTFVTSDDSLNCCSTAVSWTSPLQVMIWTPTFGDSSNNYACSVSFAAQTLGFVLRPKDSITTTYIVDTLVYLFNNTTTLKDSVLAQDSGSYVKLVAKFSHKKFTKRWSAIIVNSDSGAIDTASQVTTVLMVCDSMAAAINAGVALVTAVPFAGAVHVTSDDPGLAYLVYLGDALAGLTDTATTQVNVTSWSAKRDSFLLTSLIDRRGNLYPEIIQIIINASDDTVQGIGDSDSGYIFIWTEFAGQFFLIAADTGSIPCTLWSPYAGPPADSLFKRALWVGYRIADSSSDTTMGTDYDIDVHVMLGTK